MCLKNLSLPRMHDLKRCIFKTNWRPYRVGMHPGPMNGRHTMLSNVLASPFWPRLPKRHLS